MILCKGYSEQKTFNKMGVWDIFRPKEKPPLPEKEKREKEEELRSRLETLIYWLEQAERRGNKVEAKVRREEIDEVIEELAELGVELEEEELRPAA